MGVGMEISYCSYFMMFCSYLADPYVAAENFLSVNNLPSYYLDQVAEFIIKNAGEYHGPSSVTATDPFTGKPDSVPQPLNYLTPFTES